MYTKALLLLLLVSQFSAFFVLGGPAEREALWTKAGSNARLGTYLKESTLHPLNINTTSFGKIYSRNVVGQVYAQVLYMPDVALAAAPAPAPASSIKMRNLIFVATQANYVYAFDADDPEDGSPVWVRQLGPSAPIADNVLGMNGDSPFCHPGAGYSNIAIEVGITGTPVIDTSKNILYVVAMNKDAPRVYHHRIFALDVATGADRIAPALISADYPNNSGQRVVFNSMDQLQRPGLLLSQGIVYVAFGSFCDTLPYYGWILGFDATTLQLKKKWNTAPNGQGNAIWMSGDAIAADESDGSLYLQTANGIFDPNNNEFGNCLVRLSPTLANAEGIMPVVTWWKPDLSDEHMDLGSSGVTLVPNTKMTLSGSKSGWMILGNSDNFGGQGNNKVVQQTSVTAANIHQSPVFYQPSNAFYTWPEEESIKQLELKISSANSGQFSVVKDGSFKLPVGQMPGGMLTLSANGADFDSAIVWGSRPVGDAKDAVRPGILHAFKANDVSGELWNSEQQQSGYDRVGAFPKFVSPTVMDGRVYLPTQSYGNDNKAQVNVYGHKRPRVLDAPMGLPNSAKSGETVTLYLRATGRAPLNYTWYSNCANDGNSGSNSTAVGSAAAGAPTVLSGSKGKTLQITLKQSLCDVWVVVTNPWGSSESARIKVPLGDGPASIEPQMAHGMVASSPSLLALLCINIIITIIIFMFVLI